MRYREWLPVAVVVEVVVGGVREVHSESHPDREEDLHGGVHPHLQHGTQRDSNA